MPRAWTIHLFGALCVCLALLLAPTPAAAQTGVAGTPLPTCVLRDTGGMNPAELIRHPERFDCAVVQTRLGAGDYWVISRAIARRSEARDPLRIRSGSLWQQGVTLRTLYADGRIDTLATDARGITPFIQLGAIAEWPIAHAEAPVVRVMWHIRGAANLRGIVVDPRLATESQSVAANLWLATLYSTFAGLCFALIVYNLALWGALRHHFQLYYCVMATALLGYTWSSSGALAWTFPDITNNDRLRCNYLLLGIVGATALIFARSFFEDRVFRGWLGHYTRIVAALIFSMGLLFFVTSPYGVRWADAMFTVVFLGLSTVVVPTLWRAWRERSNYLWLFAIGWGVPILGAVLRMLSNLHVLPWSFWLDNSTIVSMALEAVLSSLAIAYRIKILREERDYAIASEVLARRLADTDPLTGLLNRRSFLSQGMKRPGEQLLILADLDHFKRVNETLGHDGGDEVLRLVARLLRTHVPAGSLVARIGGEEFAILCPSTEPVEPEGLLARLRATRMPFDLQVTASIGVSRGMLRNESEWKRLYRRADLALFEAKSAGRDRARAATREAA